MVKTRIVCAAYSEDQGKTIYTQGDGQQMESGGLGTPLLLYRALKMVNKGYVKFEDTLTAGAFADKEHDAEGSLGIVRGEEMKLLTAFSAVAATGAPDAAIVLARHLSDATEIKTLASLKKTAVEWGLSDGSVATVSGRNFPGVPEQYFTVNDLISIAQKLLPFDAGKILRINSLVYKDVFLQTDSILGTSCKIINFLCFGAYGKNAVAMAEIKGETVFVAALGARTAFERDSAILNTVYYCENPNVSENRIKQDAAWIHMPGNTVTLCGDTYFGEWYTVNRIKRGISDPLQKYAYTDEGYAYSLEKVKAFLPDTSYNIVNYEAVLTPGYQEGSKTSGYTDFSLGGDPVKSPKALKNANINAVLLANNHMMDYGAAGCRQTIDAFARAGIHTMGAGRNFEEAERPLCLLTHPASEAEPKIKIIVFNGYWYMKRRHHILQFYSIGGNTGVACVSDFRASTFFERMSVYREAFPDAFILLAAHWGYDYSNDRQYIRSLAQKAVLAGADLIIGSGPHMVMGCEELLNAKGEKKIVMYSIGHFVFNTTGRDFEKNRVLPYGVIAKLVSERNSIFLRLYPIYVDNQATFWQPCAANESQMDEFMNRFSMDIDFSSPCKDDAGYFIQRRL
jgi:poly-gamma-glutamate capsule biosynthesis protein CapA/YwtB (metallophosphatase superfamily)